MAELQNIFEAVDAGYSGNISWDKKQVLLFPLDSLHVSTWTWWLCAYDFST